MCGRYYIDDDDEDERLIAILMELNRGEQPAGQAFSPGEIFPTSLAPVILKGERGSAVRLMKWGFPRIGGGGVVINSRSEKADCTPMFQRAVRERRCLVPMTGFYEWRRTASGGKTKEKYAFRAAAAGRHGLTYLAGIYGTFCGGFENGGYEGFAILTRSADGQMSPYHDRMPVVLEGEEAKKTWLFAPPDFPYDSLRRLFTPTPLRVARVDG